MIHIHYKKTALILLLLGVMVVGYGLYSAECSSVAVAFLDVGQGDAIFVSLPGGQQVLIDGGPSEDIVGKLSSYMPLFDRTIELVVLTHPHSDHARGINEIFEVYNVERVLLTGVVHESRTYQEFFTAGLEAEGAEIYVAHAGDIVWVGDVALATVLSPTDSMLGIVSEDVNQTSVVLDMKVGDMRFLLTGDIEEEVERVLVDQGLISDVDVLKVGHQGSRNATSPAFLEAAKPEIAVISVGNNNYGHPSPEVLERLSAAGVAVLRTDEKGDIVWRFE